MNESTTKLVEALTAADDPKLAPLIKRARTEEFHDYQSPHVCGLSVLVGELHALRHDALAERVKLGEFDGTREESQAWATSPDGQATIRELGKPMADALGFPWPGDPR